MNISTSSESPGNDDRASMLPWRVGRCDRPEAVACLPFNDAIAAGVDMVLPAATGERRETGSIHPAAIIRFWLTGEFGYTISLSKLHRLSSLAVVGNGMVELDDFRTVDRR